MTIHRHIAAGIDLGSNTFRLLVADCSGGDLKVLAKELATVRLGRGLEENGVLCQESMEKGFAVLHQFRNTLAHLQPQSIRVCGTEALRLARNSSGFLQKAAEILQQPVAIIPGHEEAGLSLAGVLAGCKRPVECPLLLVDVGGGSTELLYAASPAAETRVESVGLGVVGLTEKFFAAPQPDLEQLDGLLSETFIPALEKLQLLHSPQPPLLIGCGGTATSMAALDRKLAAYNESLVHGHVLQNSAMEVLWDRLAALPSEKRNALPCLGEGRGEILPAGIRIYSLLLKLLHQDRMQVSDTGLLEGILLSSLPHNGIRTV